MYTQNKNLHQPDQSQRVGCFFDTILSLLTSAHRLRPASPHVIDSLFHYFSGPAHGHSDGATGIQQSHNKPRPSAEMRAQHLPAFNRRFRADPATSGLNLYGRSRQILPLTSLTYREQKMYSCQDTWPLDAKIKWVKGCISCGYKVVV